jgi:tRNA modification GTPase
LFVTDGSAEIDAEDNAVLSLINNKNYIHVENKIDKKKNNSAKKYPSSQKVIAVSSVTGEGIEELKQKIFNKLNLPNMVESGIILTNERHKQAMQTAYENINKALYSISTATLDLVSIDLKLAYSALGEITGNTTGEDIIDAIFSKFCLGK